MMTGYVRGVSQKDRNDCSMEAKIGRFMMDHLWRRMGAQERVEDAYRQIHGIDIQIGDSMFIDEKCKYYDSRTGGFMTELLQWPSFEVTMVNRAGNLQTGWFLNEQNLTTHYAFVQPFSTNPSPKTFTPDDLEKVNVLILKRSDLDQMKQEQDFRTQAMELMESYRITNERRRIYPGRPYRLTYTPTFNEQPVNIVVSRDWLKTLPNTRELEIHPDGRIVDVR